MITICLILAAAAGIHLLHRRYRLHRLRRTLEAFERRERMDRERARQRALDDRRVCERIAQLPTSQEADDDAVCEANERLSTGDDE